MYAIQALWSAAHYEVGVLLIVMANGRYAVMDGLAAGPGRRGLAARSGRSTSPGSRACLGCPAVNVSTHDELIECFDDVLPGLAARREPLLVEVDLGCVMTD